LNQFSQGGLEVSDAVGELQATLKECDVFLHSFFQNDCSSLEIPSRISSDKRQPRAVVLSTPGPGKERVTGRELP
jgi:hypothetical protein